MKLIAVTRRSGSFIISQSQTERAAQKKSRHRHQKLPHLKPDKDENFALWHCFGRCNATTEPDPIIYVHRSSGTGSCPGSPGHRCRYPKPSCQRQVNVHYPSMDIEFRLIWPSNVGIINKVQRASLGGTVTGPEHTRDSLT